MAWMMLIPTFTLDLIGAWMSYAEWAKGTWWLFVVMIALSSSMAVLWSITISIMENNSEIIAFSLAWDIGLLAIYAGFPIMFCGEKLTARAWIALSLAILAVIWFKLETDH
jgi:hypothetical protein